MRLVSELPLVRRAVPPDAEPVRMLLGQLDYFADLRTVQHQLLALMAHPDHELWVAEQEGAVVGLISLHFIPQLPFLQEAALICYLVVDRSMRRRGVGKLLEAKAAELARQRGCLRLRAHCAEGRTAAHHFYARRGYREDPKFFSKKI